MRTNRAFANASIAHAENDRISGMTVAKLQLTSPK